MRASPTCWRKRRRSASTAPMTASRRVSASRPTSRSAWMVSAACRSGRSAGSSSSFRSSRSGCWRAFRNHSKVFDAPQAVGELKYRDTAAIDAEIARYKRLSAPMKSRFSELFMNALRPASSRPRCSTRTTLRIRTISTRSRARCRSSIAGIVDAGFILQIDAPDLAMERVLLYQDASDAEFAKLVEQHVAALNARPGRHSARSGAAACLLGQLRGAA